MQVKLAGYNIDKEEIDKLKDKDRATPETISAAYARISRSRKSVTDLRDEALSDVAKARKSNQNIVFEMGHASVAEHAVFNFDVLGISRLLVEEIQRSRLASFTEKSQRYVTLKGDYLVPDEVKNTELEIKFKSVIEKQNDLYELLYEKGKQHLETTGFEGTLRELQGKAKEDARYVLALATETQFGMTINARSLERLLQRLDRSRLDEAKELKDKLLNRAEEIAPSLVKYSKCEEFERNICKVLPETKTTRNNDDISLLYITPEAENWILAGMMFESNCNNLKNGIEHVKTMSDSDKEAVFGKIFKDLKSWQRMPRSFELVEFKFMIMISSCCFGQLKRHRMATILKSRYNPENGYVIPPLLEEIDAMRLIEPVMEKVDSLYYELEAFKEGLGAYILTNSHKIPVILQANLRELYHFSRLRSDKHAQWEIRDLSKKIEQLIKQEMPNAASMLMGKDEFIEKYVNKGCL